MQQTNYNEIKADILKMIECIKVKAFDFEVAHSYEDDLREIFLNILIEKDLTKAQTKELAILVLSTKDIEFTRYCA